MSRMQLTTGEPVPEDRSHTELLPNGQQKGYVVLAPEEIAKGFVKPYRTTYIHEKCGVLTSMGRALSETYARDPHFYSGTFCCACGKHFPLNEFHWDADGEPMDPELQEAWNEGRALRDANDRLARAASRLRSTEDAHKAARLEYDEALSEVDKLVLKP